MSNSAAYLVHDHDPQQQRTLREWADIAGKKTDTVMKTVRRRLGAGHYTLDSHVSADEFAGLFKTVPAVVRVKKTDTRTDKTRRPATTTPTAPAVTFHRHRTRILYTLMAMPAAASIQNMYSVTADIAAHQFAAVLLTGLFSASPFLFVLAGIRSWFAKTLTGLMIAYECFANLTRIYGGLTGFGHKGFPTRFLGLVTEIFNSGTYATAKVLALLMAALAAAVFYAAYYELIKRR